MKYTNILTIIIALAVSITLNAQDNTFNGTADSDWDNAANWSTGKVPPVHIVQKITIAADCVVPSSNSTDYTFAKGSTFQIDSSITFTNNGTGTWTMNGTYDKDGTYVGNLVINGTIGPGINADTLACGDSIIYDGKSYATVQIGGQCWMAENLDIGIMINSGSNQTDNNIIEKYCFNNDAANCATYGGLYQWNEMMQYTTAESTQGVCPTGWHLPSDDEWKTLEMQLGMTQAQADATGFRGTNEGSKMAGNASLWIDGVLDSDPAFGTSGLAVLPASFRNTNGSFYGLSYYAYLWSSTEFGSSAWYRKLYFFSTDVYRHYGSKAFGFSVRCVRDD